MKKLHSSRTEIFSNRIRTKTVMQDISGGNRSWGFGVKVFVSECPTRQGEAEQHPVPPLSRKTESPAFVPTQAAILVCGKIPLSPIPHNVDHAPAKWIPGGAER